MLTNAQKKYNEDYVVLRMMLITCKYRQVNKVADAKIWIRGMGNKTAKAAERELEKRLTSDYFKNMLSRPSEFEQDELQDLERMNKEHKKYGDDDE